MSWLYRRLLRPALFAQEAEQAHHRAMRALGWASRYKSACAAVEHFFGAPSLPVELFGLKFPNPVGLAAGMDKCAEAVPAWQALGFGFCELGAVTWHPQPGNAAPRLFRAIPDGAIINRMGFNNPGAEAFAQKLDAWRKSGRWPNHPVGINLGKSKIAALDQAAEDYAQSFRALRPHVDFVVVNVSSPNTPGLRQLQDKAALDEILAAIQQVQAEGVESRALSETLSFSLQSPGSRLRSPMPILVKIAPDLSFSALDEILELVATRQIAGIVATNTTISRPETADAGLQRIYAEPGGLSGRPLRARSTEIIQHIFKQTKGRLPIIGSGGIFNAADAWEKITAGASLIELYTGLIYAGPSVASEIVKGLLLLLEKCALKDLRQAIGSAVR